MNPSAECQALRLSLGDQNLGPRLGAEGLRSTVAKQKYLHGEAQRCGCIADPEDILLRQQEIRRQIQGGESRREEYSTYEQDKAELDARHKLVDVSFLCSFAAVTLLRRV